jgi:2-methylcitrate dehydratase PrpD
VHAAGDSVVAAGAAGHLLDSDDSFLPGPCHLSAPTAPVALMLGGELGTSVDETLAAYAAGFEATGGGAVTENCIKAYHCTLDDPYRPAGDLLEAAGLV